MRPFVLLALLVGALLLAPAAWADETAEGSTWSVRLPKGFTKQFDSCSGDGG